MAIVSAALTRFDLIALNATLTFSQNNVNPFTVLPSAKDGTKIHLFFISASGTLTSFFTFARVKTYIPSTERGIQAFAELGSAMREGAAGACTGAGRRFHELIGTLYLSNPWFTPENVRLALSAVGRTLTEENLTRWLSEYPELKEPRDPVTVGVVMAGNIPMVGFHDLLCVLISGNRLLARLSTRDELLMRAVAVTLAEIEPAYDSIAGLTTDRLTGFGKVIATGSNNTSRYFEYYFRNVSSIIRKNRNSIAILDGTESDRELELLGDDIFSYFGLGCRNVTKLYLPRGYDPASLLPRWERFESIRSHYRYMVNYDHHRAVMIVNRESYIDGRFIMLRESSSLTPPMAVLHYEFYDTGQGPYKSPEMSPDLLQCIAGHGHLPFGTTQQPELWNYADNIDTISFLLKK